jgi:hypothetical protein
LRDEIEITNLQRVSATSVRRFDQASARDMKRLVVLVWCDMTVKAEREAATADDGLARTKIAVGIIAAAVATVRVRSKGAASKEVKMEASRWR